MKLLLVVVLAGCSVVTTKGAPPPCTTSKTAVYVDGVISAAASGTALFLGIAALANEDKRTELGYATLGTFLGSLGFAVSGIVGGLRVKSCRGASAQPQWQAPPSPP